MYGIKSAMETSELQELMKKRIKLMRMILTWPQEKRTLKNQLIMISYVTYIGIMLFLTLTALGDITNEMGTLIILSMNMGCWLSSAMKVIFALFRPCKFDDLTASFDKVKFPSKDDPLYDHLQNKLKFTNLLTKFFMFGTFSVATLQTLIGISSTHFGGSDRHLIFYNYLPVNEMPAWLFWGIFISQFLTEVLVCLHIIFTDCTCFALISFAVAKLRIMKNNLLSINDIDTSELTVGVHDDEVEEKLNEFVREHVIVNNYVQAITGAFSYTILAELMVILVFISIALMSINIAPFGSFEFFINLCFISSLGVACAGFCFHGNELINECEEIREAQYFINWHYFGPSQRKTLFIMMERTMKPMEITAGKFVVLNNLTFVSICRTAFSYYTVMLQLYSASNT